jgi:bifunctional non-homologous end joining protein LigD
MKRRAPRARSADSGEPEQLRFGPRSIRLTNPDKGALPAHGFTKRQVVDYYIAVAPYLLPHLENRPVTLKRYPDGTRGQFFYEKDAPTFTPDWVQTFPVPRRAGGPDIRYIVINDVPTLAWCATLANLEVHPFLHRIPRIDVPTAVVFDLDPGEGMDIFLCGEVALLLRQALDGVGLQVFPKVSASKGLQLHVPLNMPVTYEETGHFALVTAQTLERAYPRLVVTDMAKARRVGKVFIDWNQNADYKTTVAVHSLRAKRDQPFVSFPVRWDELERAIATRSAASLSFDPATALGRLADVGDLFQPVLRLRQPLPLAAASPRRGRQRVKSTAGSQRAYRQNADSGRRVETPAGVVRASRQAAGDGLSSRSTQPATFITIFRREMHGALKSWAVPKGVPQETDERRLAMATEDHPIECLDFEGTIPPGQYGAGTVMVWDIGTYDILEGNYCKGDLEVSLRGRSWRVSGISIGMRILGGHS